MLGKALIALAAVTLLVPATVPLLVPATAGATVRVHRVKVQRGTRLPAVPRGTHVRNLRRRTGARVAAVTGDRAAYDSALAGARAARDALPAGTPRNESPA
jgi:hypothetical protein